ncbi:hypothetical protein HG531_003409 [Fusarium graminearum]|nr:hypothetical protein HG531_003409 [Fusarium graminearum]
MQLARGWGLRSGIVIQAAGKDMGFSTASPSIRLLGGVSLTIVALDVTTLGFTEPIILAAQKGIQLSQIGLAEFDVVEMGSLQKVRPNQALQLLGFSTVGRTKALHKALNDEEESGRVGVVGVLNLELRGYFATSFVTQDLLASNPAIVVHGVVPALDNFKSQIDIPIGDGDKVETLIPEEAARKERARRNAGEKLVGSFKIRLRATPGVCSFNPKFFILLFVFRSIGSVNDLVTVEVSDTTNKVGKHALAKLLVFLEIEWLFELESVCESLVEDLGGLLDLLDNIEFEGSFKRLLYDLDIGLGGLVSMSVFEQFVVGGGMLSGALCYGKLVVSQSLRVSAESDIVLETKLCAFTFNIELTFAVLGDVIEKHGLGVLCGTFSKLALDASGPASAMIASWNLDKCRCQVNIVALVVD